MILKQSTAFTFRIGPFVDDADGKTAETGLTIAQADIQISKNGGAFAQTSASPTTTHDTDGWYQCPLTATDTGTLGTLDVQIAMAGALPVWRHFVVVPAVVYDSLVAGSDYLTVDAVQIEGVDATNQIRDAVVDDATRIDASALNTLSGHDPGEVIMGATDLGTGAGLTSLATAANLTTLTGYVDTEVAAILAAVDTEVAAIKAKTDNLPASPAAVGSAMTLSAGAITSGSFAAGAIDAAAIAADAIGASELAADAAAEIGTAVWASSTRTLSSFGTLVTDIWAAGTRTLTSAADSAGVTTLLSRIVGTLATGTHNPQSGDAYARLGAPAGASVSADVAAVKAQTAAIEADTGTDGVVVAAASKTGYSLTATTGLGNQTANITGNLSGSVGSVTGAVGSVTGAVGSVTGAVTVGTNNDKTGYALSSAGVQAIWDALTSALTTVGSVGKRIADNLDGTISSRLAGASYTAPPSAATNASAVRTELATELGRINVPIDSRLAPATAGRTLDVDANGVAAANVTLWKGTAPADLDASGNVLAKLADSVVHGGEVAQLNLKKLYLWNDDPYGVAFQIYAPQIGAKGLSISASDQENTGLYVNLTGATIRRFVTEDTGETEASAGSVAALSGGGSLTAADIWSYVTRTLTQSSTSTTDSTTAGSISRRRGDSWSISLTLGAITGYTSLWFTVKAATSDADTAAIFQIKKNASGSGDGLLYVNGATASSAALGSITVSDATTGAVIIALDETITDDLTPASYVYDCQALISGSVSTPDSGTFTVTADVTRVVA